MSDELPFTFELIEGAAFQGPRPLSVCPDGHLVVSGRSCWVPVRFSADLRAIFCAPTDCDRAGND